MSRIIDLLTAIKNNTTYSTETYSRIEAILKSIANDTPYTDEEQSRHEELLLAIKNGETTTLVPQTKIEELLVAIANGTLDDWLVGKNLFDVAYYASGINLRYYRKGENGNLFITTLDVRGGEGISNTFTLQKNTNYTLSCENVVETIRISNGNMEWIAGGDGISTVTFNTGNYNTFGIKFIERENYPFDVGKVKLEIGSTATPYSCYCFNSELEQAYYEASAELRGE